MKAYEKVKNARKSDRPMTGYYIENMISDFIELHGDRRFKDDSAIIAGIGFLGNMPVTVIGMERGKSLQDRIKRNFGCPSPDGYRKALRLMKQAEKYKRPVICFIDSSGAYCGIDAEERGQGEAIAENLMEMMTLKTPIVSVVIGEGGSGGALALGVADNVIMLENSVYSVISPEGCATILWKDSSKADEAAEILKITANELCRFNIVDDVIEESEKTSEEVCAELKEKIVQSIKKSSSMSVYDMLEKRYYKYRNIGA
ncbi:MAG: acetyl-CoA carboxylase carboxyltransferase subunit alpha [Bacillota bacterium]|nr:acetyl-CoA carboxylase carboxyltransferase subunit alpha [Bacillota bacterium]